MPLTSGTRLGTYEIVGPLGAGGMGEVYRAKDLRLGRDVALKVLPVDVASFEKEDASAIGASCMANVALGRLEEGLAAGEQGAVVSHRSPFFLGILGWALAVAGRDGEARTVLEELRARPAGSPTAVAEAWLLGALGEIDDAFDVLARAEEEHQGLLCYTGLPGFDPLRADARFAALMRRLELSPA